MKHQHIGIGLILLAILLAKFLPMNELSTGNIAIRMGFGAMAYIGVLMVMGALMPNPTGPDFKMWKMLLNATLGFVALIAVLVLGIMDAGNRVNKELKDYGVIANAVVVNKDYTTLPTVKGGKMNYIFYLTVQFQDQNGVLQQVTSEVEEFNFVNTDPEVPLKINYSSREPNINRLIFR